MSGGFTIRIDWGIACWSISLFSTLTFCLRCIVVLPELLVIEVALVFDMLLKSFEIDFREALRAHIVALKLLYFAYRYINMFPTIGAKNMHVFKC